MPGERLRRGGDGGHIMSELGRALVVVDMQASLVEKDLYEKRRLLATIGAAISRSRAAGESVVFVRHEGAGLKAGAPGWEIHPGVDRRPEDPVVDKRRGDAFEGTGLTRVLAELKVGEILVCGLASHGCVRATCLGGASIGLSVGLLRGGHSNWARDAAARIEKVERELAAEGIGLVDLSQG
jgi:nicotinamidase-related amidase